MCSRLYVLTLPAGNTDVIELLLARGARVNKVTTRQVSPLFTAVQHGHLDVVQMLIGAGADVNLGHRSKTPLARAQRDRKTGIATVLVVAGAT